MRTFPFEYCPFLIAQTHISKSISLQLCCQMELVCIKILPLAFHRSWVFCKWDLFVKCLFLSLLLGISCCSSLAVDRRTMAPVAPGTLSAQLHQQCQGGLVWVCVSGCMPVPSKNTPSAAGSNSSSTEKLWEISGERFQR